VIKKSNISGFTLLELVLVVSIISILSAYLIALVLPEKKDSYNSVINFQAKVFARSVNVLYGISISKDKNVIEHQGVNIFVNEFGWPSNTSEELSPLSDSQTPLECLQLWKAIFNNPLQASVSPLSSFKEEKVDSKYRIYAIDGNVCRYQLVGKSESDYFFDYDVRSGSVIVSTDI